jgi:hypothetical protein
MNPFPHTDCEDCQVRLKDNEVARLRDLLNRAIEIADKALDCLIPVFRGEHEEIETELKQLKAEAQLASAPEEPSRDQVGTKSSDTVPSQSPTQTDWRELGPDEVICEGDEVQPKHHSRDGEWIKAWPYEIGGRSGIFYSMRYRTRRPLCPNDAPKQEETPLEKEIAEMESGRVVQIMPDGTKISENPDPKLKAVASAIRYLRDEIAKLKEAK